MSNILNDAYTEQAAAADPIINDPEPFEDDFDDPGDPQPIRFDFGFLKTPTGPGPIDEYLDHPLNATGSRGMAQIIRGCTGFAGSLDLAIIDITLGALQLVKEKNIPEPAAPARGVNYEPIIKP